MSKIERFEGLIAWQKARVLTSAIYQATRKEAFVKDFGLSGQIQRAAVSIMSSTAEGFERDSPNEFHHFLIIARASCAEVRSQLYVAYDIGYLEEGEFDQLMSQTLEVVRIISGLRTYIASRRKPKV
ncbi:MAG: four helix bundle protein [Chloroflexota bacterium]|nr:MAG: four helix bundle protein [Chloroflexota bacterium]